jgi:hypothetical protein
MVVKSVKRPKSTVAGVVVMTGTGFPDPEGMRLAEVIVTTNDWTSQMGASVPKVTSDPGGSVTTGVVVDAPPPAPPQPTIRTIPRPPASAGNIVVLPFLMPILL